jgi:hypothetical protein
MAQLLPSLMANDAATVSSPTLSAVRTTLPSPSPASSA